MEQRIVLALWRPAGLFDAPLRQRLTGLGATTLQLNVSDQAVSEAMRLTAFSEPVDAVASLTGDVDEAGLAALLDGAAERWTGWRVETREPLVPPAVPDGERLDALANVALLRKPDDLPYDEWRAIWQGDHTTVAIETQATFGYVQNRVLAPLAGGDVAGADVVAVVEEHFPMAATTDPHAFYGSGGDDAELRRRMARMFASIGRFGAAEGLDLVPTSRYRWRLVP